MSLSKINYPPALLSWLASTLQIGFLGEIQFVAPALAGTYGYHHELLKWGVPEAHIHTTLVAAEAAMLADRNDVACVFGVHLLQAATIDWDKDHTHVVGMAGNNVRGGYNRPYVYSTDTGIDHTIDITGAACQFHNISFANQGDHGDCVSGAHLNGESCTFKNVNIVGNIRTNQLTDAECASLIIDTDGSMCVFENCMIGDDVNGLRTGANSGQLLFPSVASGPGNGLFKDCTFLSRSEQANVAMVARSDDHAIDRLWTFDNCLFHNFWQDQTDECNQVFYHPGAGQTACIALKNCMAIGYDEWTDSNYRKVYQINMPIASVAGGLAIEPTTSIE